MTLLISDLAATSAVVGATSKRTEKRDALADLVSRAEPDEVPIVVAMLTGQVRQGRIGVGWATVGAVAVEAAAESTVSVSEFDRLVDRLASMSGAGSTAGRTTALTEFLARLTADEAQLVRQLFEGGLRHGALEGVMIDAVAKAAGVKLAVMRRAAMLKGDVPETARIAMTDGEAGLTAVGLTVLNPIQPMLAKTAADITEAMPIGDGDVVGVHLIEWKIDGIRVQVHRQEERVRIYTRNLNDVTDRLTDLVDLVSRFDVGSVVLDGEVVGQHGDEPIAFQETASQFGEHRLRPYFFDILHRDGVDLIDLPLVERRRHLDEVTGPYAVPVIETDRHDAAQTFLDETVSAGHEGVMVKSIESTYEAGRRGVTWRKIKPVITLDLVVIAAEWGHGRRTGWLSNLHLGARDPEGGPPVMVGKTFKGLTDQLLTWQTEQFLAREVSRSRNGHVVHIEPELVVEIAIDGVQTSTRYAGGAALRFARVRHYRPDKTPADADTIDTVLALRR